MALYAIADLHLPLGTGKSMNIFGGWENYVDRLENNWRNTIKNEDTVVIAGDISWAMKLEEAYKDFEFIDSLPGKKIFLKGNHDYWWSTRKKVDTYFQENSFNSISVIYNSAEVVGNIAVCGTRGWFYDSTCEDDIKVLNREVQRLQTSLELARQTGFKPVVFLHYPPIFKNFECKEIIDVLLKNAVKDCYYGHIHGKRAINKAFIGEYKGINFHLISGDYTGFTPILVG